MRWFRIFVFFLFLCTSGFSESLVFQTFLELTRGLPSREGKFFEELLKRHKVLNLEKSGFPELAEWIEKLNSRLSEAIEKDGNQFGTYRVYLIASEEHIGFIHKYRPPGQQFYRGHVFLSTKLLETYLERLSPDGDALTDDQLTVMMTAIQGVASHEFVHPKEDELIKFDLLARGREDDSRDHDQTDEMATDLLAVKLLRTAKLDPYSILLALELLYGIEPSRREESRMAYGRRVLDALLEVHPAQKLRLTILRAALTHDRVEAGDPETDPIPFRADPLRRELSRLAKADRLWLGPSENPLVAAFQGLAKTLGRNARHGDHEYYIRYLRKFREIVATRGTPVTDDELDRYLALQKDLLADAIEFLVDYDHWIGPRDRDDEQPYAAQGLWAPEPGPARERQRVLATLPFYTHAKYQSWLAARVAANPFDLFEHGKKAPGLETLTSVLPARDVARVYRAALDRLHERPSNRERAKALLAMWWGNVAMGGPSEFDLEIVEKLRALGKADPEMSQEIGASLWPLLDMDRAHFQGRFLRWDREHADRKGHLLHEWAGWMRDLIAEPSGFLRTLVTGSRLTGKGELYPRIAEILAWDTEPSSFPTRFEVGKKIPTGPFFEAFRDLWRSPVGQKMILEQLKRFRDDQDYYWNFVGLFTGRVVLNTDYPLSLDQRRELLQILRGKNLYRKLGLAANSPAFRKIQGRFLESLRGPLQPELIADWYQEMRCTNVDDFAAKVREAFEAPDADLIHKMFDSKAEVFISFLVELRRRRVLTQADVDTATRGYLMASNPDEMSHHLFGSQTSTMFHLYRTLRRRGLRGTRLLRELAYGFRTEGFKRSEDFLHRDARYGERTEAAAELGAVYVPAYYSFIAGLGDPLRADFIAEEDFVARFDQALEFLHQCFNADGVAIPVHLKGMYPVSRLDDLAPIFLALVPPRGLTPEQYEKIWREVSTKRASHHTDAFFETHVLSRIQSRDAIREVLANGMIQSERLRVLLLKRLVGSDVEALFQRRDRLRDRDLYDLLATIQSYCPRASRSRDEFLEEIAWKLRLREAQLVKFIEPAKTYNYSAMDKSLLRILSAVSVLLERMSEADKLAFVKYIREPRGELVRAVPAVGEWLKTLTDAGANLARSKMLDLVQDLESMLRDAGEVERHLLIELFVGTTDVGLWHSGPAWRERLYEQLGLLPGTQNRVLLDTHLAARPEYEHTVLLSYLLSLDRQAAGAPFDLVRVLEMFRAPGVKFAQIASILGVFGEENSRRLAETKDRAMVPTMLETYRMLKKVYPEALYREVKHLEVLLGSGSIKVVVLVEFLDGTVEAVYIKRPNTEATIASNLGMLERWMGHLRLVPEYADAYDYEYLIGLLRRQLKMDTDFPTELANNLAMAPIYERAPRRGGWSFASVKPTKRLQSDEVMHFTAVRNGVRYAKLAEADKRSVAELILDTELGLLLDEGVFDAERTVGNYLFDPTEKKVYAIDLPQVYRLHRGFLLAEDDRTRLARVFRALVEPPSTDVARLLAEALLELSENKPRLDAAAKRDLVADIETALRRGGRLDERLLRVTGIAHRRGVRLPLHCSLGVMKAMSILSKEEYSKFVDEDFIRARLERFVKRQAWRSAGARFLRPVRRLLRCPEEMAYAASS